MLRILAILLFTLNSMYVFSQKIPDGYTLVTKINTPFSVTESAGRGGGLSPFFHTTHDEKYLVLEYGYKPTLMSVFEFGTWKPLGSFLTSPWVYEIYSHDSFIYTVGDNAIRRMKYFQINVSEQSVMEVKTIDGRALQGKKFEEDGYSSDQKYYFTIEGFNTFQIYTTQP